MEPKGSLLRSQQPVTCPIPEPDESYLVNTQATACQGLAMAPTEIILTYYHCRPV